MRTTATAIATRTAPRTSQRVRLQPARPCCCCSRYVLIPLSTRLATQTFHRCRFLTLFLHTRGERSMTRGRTERATPHKGALSPDAALESRLRIAQGLPRARALTLPRERPSCGVEDSSLFSAAPGRRHSASKPIDGASDAQGPELLRSKARGHAKARSLWGEAELLGPPFAHNLSRGFLARFFSRGQTMTQPHVDTPPGGGSTRNQERSPTPEQLSAREPVIK